MIWSPPIPIQLPKKICLGFGCEFATGYNRSKWAALLSAHDIIVYDQSLSSENVALIAAAKVNKPSLKVLAYQAIMIEPTNIATLTGAGDTAMYAAHTDSTMFLPNVLFNDGIQINARVYKFDSPSWQTNILAACAALLAQSVPRYDGLFLDVCSVIVPDSVIYLNSVAQTSAQATALMSSTGLQVFLTALRAANPSTLITTNSIESWSGTNGNVGEDNDPTFDVTEWNTRLIPTAGNVRPYTHCLIKRNSGVINKPAAVLQAKNLGCALGFQDATKYDTPPAPFY